MTEVTDVLEELNLSSLVATQQPLPGFQEAAFKDDASLLESRDFESQHIDDLSRHSRTPVIRVMGRMAAMELKGRALQVVADELHTGHYGGGALHARK